MLSMTGFGCGETGGDGIKISVQISSFNRKQADIRFNLPKELIPHEIELRKQIARKISRGAITVKIESRLDPKKNNLFSVDSDLARMIFEELVKLQNHLNLDQRITIQDLVNLPNIDLIKRNDLDASAMSRIAEKALGMALSEILKTKSKEGQAIKKDLESRHQVLLKFLEKISDLAPEVPKRYQQKLALRIRENIESLPIDEERILKEVVVFADRCDISEETTRLSTHLLYMKNLFTETQPVGRKLDFLIQEVFREINTIGSKCNDIDVSTIVIDFKAELERIREQVQNIE